MGFYDAISVGQIFNIEIEHNENEKTQKCCMLSVWHIE